MPVIKKSYPPESTEHRRLVAELAAELRRNDITDLPNAPKIIEEEQYRGFIHITVLWDAWKTVEKEERGRIIMDAYDQERHDDIQKITVVLGLTNDEAQHLGITM